MILPIILITWFNDVERFMRRQVAKCQAHVETIQKYLSIYKITNNMTCVNSLIFALEKICHII